jgi:hypothetical protein
MFGNTRRAAFSIEIFSTPNTIPVAVRDYSGVFGHGESENDISFLFFQQIWGKNINHHQIFIKMSPLERAAFSVSEYMLFKIFGQIFHHVIAFLPTHVFCFNFQCKSLARSIVNRLA